MSFEISEEMVEAIVEREVEKAIDYGSISYMIRDRVNVAVDAEVRKQVGNQLNDRFKEIAEEVTSAFIDKNVEIYDGWGDRRRYDSYADFFAAELKNSLTKHEIERTVQDVVKKKVQESIGDKAKSIIKRVCDEIIVEVGGEEK